MIGHQVLVGLVMICFHHGVFECAVPAFHVASGPGMSGCGPPMVDAILMTDASKDRLLGGWIVRAGGTLDAMIGQPGVALGWDVGDHVPSELSGDRFVGFCMPLGIGPCAGTVHGDNEGELTFFRADLRDSDRAVPDRR